MIRPSKWHVTYTCYAECSNSHNSHHENYYLTMAYSCLLIPLLITGIEGLSRVTVLFSSFGLLFLAAKKSVLLAFSCANNSRGVRDLTCTAGSPLVELPGRISRKPIYLAIHTVADSREQSAKKK